MPRLAVLVLAILLAAAPSTRAQEEARSTASQHASLQVDQVLGPALALAALLGAFFTALRRWCAPAALQRDDDEPEVALLPVETPRLRVVSRSPVSDPRRRRP